MDPVSVVSFNPADQAQSAASDAARGNASTFEVAQFDSLLRAGGTEGPEAAATRRRRGRRKSEPSGFRKALSSLDGLNTSMASIGREALTVEGNQQNITPGQMMNLTVQSHHFLYQSVLTSNVASRTSEGIQQLFRQQS